MVISCLYVQTVTRQCFCFPNSQWGVTAHDNRAVISTLNVKSVQPKRLQKKVRRLNAVTTEQWEKEFNPANVLLTSNLEADIESLSKEFRRVLDTLTPVKNCSSIT